MTGELEARIIHDFAKDIAPKLSETAIIAPTVSRLGRRACRAAPLGGAPA